MWVRLRPGGPWHAATKIGDPSVTGGIPVVIRCQQGFAYVDELLWRPPVDARICRHRACQAAAEGERP